MPVVRQGVYPGSFNPPTVAHLEIAAAARIQRNLDRVDLVMSAVTLAKEHVVRPTLEERVEVVRASIAHLGWLDVAVTDDQLIADIAADYDVVIMGGDKWAQVADVGFYDSAEHRDAAVASLPELALAPRDGVALPAGSELVLDDWVLEVSSSAARAGRHDWMTSAAIQSSLWDS